jgi:peptidoglycan/xylan/chitin deacetylase (PgdA/CDA1 family)
MSSAGGSGTNSGGAAGSPPQSNAGAAGIANTSGAGGTASGGATTAGQGGADASAGGPPFAWPSNHVAAVSLTYDDGLDAQLKYVVPALDAAQLKGTFFLASFQGVDHAWALPNTTDPLNARQQAWQAVHTSGHELASHTVYHPCDNNNAGFRPEDYDLAKMGAELDDSIARLARLGATPPLTFGYPCSGDIRGIGPVDNPISYMPLVAQRFLAARASKSGVADPRTVDLQAVPLFGTTDATGPEMIAHVDEAIAAGGWTVFIFHGVGPEDKSCDINVFDLNACALNYLTTPLDAHQQLIDYLASKQSDVWVATFKDVAQHIAASRQ